jgi:hypothetical protein
LGGITRKLCWIRRRLETDGLSLTLVLCLRLANNPVHQIKGEAHGNANGRKAGDCYLHA